MLVCTIELMNGKAVILRQGVEKVVEHEDVLALAKYFGRFGELFVVDIDASVGNGNNESTIAQLCKAAQCRVGGGIKTVAKAAKLLSYGARRLVIGTAADEKFLSLLPKDKVIVAIDSKDGLVASKAWTRTVSSTPVEYIRRFNSYCSGFLYTKVENAGMLNGVDFDTVRMLREATPLELTVAGGISSVDEIVKLQKMNISPQLGLGIYVGKISLPDAFTACVDFEKRFGYIPTIVQDIDSKQVLGLCYSNKDSLLQALSTAKGAYFNREENKIFVKGATAGNTQELLNARYDCDQDCLLFKVKQKGNFCHLGRYSCFETKDNSLLESFNKIAEDIRLMPDNSDVTRLLRNDLELKKIIMQKAFEVVNADRTGGVAKESSDLLYYILIFLAKENVQPSAILDFLSARDLY